MADMVILPDAEFDVMKIVWKADAPISTVQVFNASLVEKQWKLQTVMTLLTRLEKKDFLSSEKRGKERYYWPLVARDAYLNRETGLFVKRFHSNSVAGLMGALFGGKKPGPTELNEIEAWLKEQNSKPNGGGSSV
jgi:predicted transcriptional regulator